MLFINIRNEYREVTNFNSSILIPNQGGESPTKTMDQESFSGAKWLQKHQKHLEEEKKRGVFSPEFPVPNTEWGEVEDASEETLPPKTNVGPIPFIQRPRGR